MLPLPDKALRLNVLAEYWSRELQGQRTAAEIHRELLSAFWRDELEVSRSNGDPVDRRGLLESVGHQSQHPGFVVVDSADMIPPGIVDLPNGGVIVDLTKYVVIPSDRSRWTEAIIKDAYSAFATLSLEDFHDLLKPILWALYMTKENLAVYCENLAYAPPRFWFGTQRQPKWTIRDEKKFTAWLKEISSGPKLKSKQAYFDDAHKKFPAIPWKVFVRIWGGTVPKEWKRPGPVVRSRRSKSTL